MGVGKADLPHRSRYPIEGIKVPAHVWRGAFQSRWNLEGDFAGELGMIKTSSPRTLEQPRCPPLLGRHPRERVPLVVRPQPPVTTEETCSYQ